MRHVALGWVAIALCVAPAMGCSDPGGREASDTEVSTSGTMTGSAGPDGTSGPVTSDATSESTSSDAGPTSVSESATEGSSSESAGTGGPDCGNAELDPGEACDDGNDVPSDGCNNDCVVSGSVIWTHTHASGLGEADENWGVAADDAGDVYVAGFTQADVGDPQIFLRGYSRPGGLRWTQTVGAAAVVDQGFGVAHAGGALYFVGTIDGGGQGANVWFARYDLQGGLTWQTSATGNPLNGSGIPIAGNDGGRGVAIGPDGNPVVVGFFVETNQGQNAWVRKNDPNGAELWSGTYAGSEAGNEQALAVAVDSANRVLVVGFEQNTTRDMVLRKLDGDGSPLWVQPYDGVAMLADTGYGVAVTADDEIVVAGHEGAAESDGLFFVRRYDVDGNEVWTDRHEGGQAEGAQARRVAVAPEGDLLVAGLERDAGLWKATVTRYDEDGEVKWESRIDGAPMTESFALDITVAADGTIYVAGIQDRGVDGRDAWVARLAP